MSVKPPTLREAALALADNTDACDRCGPCCGIRGPNRDAECVMVERASAVLAALAADEKREAVIKGLIDATESLLKFNEELCSDVGVSIHYPSAERARRALAAVRDAGMGEA